MKPRKGPSNPYFRGSNWGRRKPPPTLKGKKVELVSMEASSTHTNRWNVVVKINGWPHTLKLWGKDELAIMSQIIMLQQKEETNDHS